MTHSFPTRRSSELGDGALQAAPRGSHRQAALHPPRRSALRHWRHPYGPCDEQGAEGHRRPFGEPSRVRCALHSRRSEEHTSELQSLMRISYAVFCLKQKKTYTIKKHTNNIA